MNHIDATRTQPHLELLNLPEEILAHICSHLVPSHQTFLIRQRGYEELIGSLQSDAPASPRVLGTPLLPEHEPAPERPATIFSNHKVDVFTLLLSSKLHPHIVESLYSNNTFYTPEPGTLFSLRASLSALAVSFVRTIRVEGCGPAKCYKRGYGYSYGWPELADTDITLIPELFPGLRELRIGGIGAGIVHKRWFTYRGAYSHRQTETRDIWSLENISLIGRIVGVSTTDPSQVDTGSDDHFCRSMRGDGHALCSGRVFCMRNPGSESGWAPSGKLRLHGTRIVRRGVSATPRSEEQEVDVVATIAEAKDALEKAKAAGLIEVKIGDTS